MFIGIFMGADYIDSRYAVKIVNDSDNTVTDFTLTVDGNPISTGRLPPAGYYYDHVQLGISSELSWSLIRSGKASQHSLDLPNRDASDFPFDLLITIRNDSVTAEPAPSGNERNRQLF